MTEHNVKQIVYTASAGVLKELTGIMGKIIMLVLKNPLIDHRAAIEHFKAHDLTNTIVRPMSLSDKEFSGVYRESATNVPDRASSISRANTAHFILKALTDSNYDNTSIGHAT